MKILFITSVVPYPPHRGDKLRIFNIIKFLSVGNQVKTISFVKNDIERSNAVAFSNLGYNIFCVEQARVKGLINILRSLWTGEPLQVSFHHSKRMHELISQETEKNEYDIIYFHLFTVAQYHISVKSKSSLKVYDITDATALYLKRYLDFITNPFKKLYLKLERNRIVKYELISSFFDLCYVCSKVDLDYLNSKKINSHFRLFTNGFDSSQFTVENVSYQKHRIIFTGNMPYFPNKDAAIYFAKEVFPIIQKKYPDATFYIVGQNPTYEIISLKSESIFITGFVEDIKTEYLLSEVNVAPIRFGAGIQNKIIEALALGVPTVSSNMSVLSFDEDIKKYIFTAETAEEFARAVINIFTDSSVRNNMMKECMKEIRKKMTWEKIVQVEKEYLNTLVLNKCIGKHD